jgi:hypothetical protein
MTIEQTLTSSLSCPEVKCFPVNVSAKYHGKVDEEFRNMIWDRTKDDGSYDRITVPIENF